MLINDLYKNMLYEQFSKMISKVQWFKVYIILCLKNVNVKAGSVLY